MIQETQLGRTPESDPFGFRAVKSATPAAEELPGERPHQDEALSRLHRQERPAKPFRAPSSRLDGEIWPFVLALAAMLCATFIGFMSEIRPVDPNSSDHGYDETLGTRTAPPSGANFPIHSSHEDVAIFGEGRGGRDELGARATIGCVDMSSTAKSHSMTTGGEHVD